MKKLGVLIAFCLGILSSHAQVIVDVDFSTYSDGDVTGNAGWVATSGSTFNVVSGELEMAHENAFNNLGYIGQGVSVDPGERIRLTIDNTISIPNDRKHMRLLGFGVNTNALNADTISDGMVHGFNNFWGAELTRFSGQLNYTADQDEWWTSDNQNNYAHTRLALEDCGFNPFGYDTNTLTDVGVVDSDSDAIRVIYEITKSHISNQWNAVVTTSNLVSGISYSSEAKGMVRAGAWAGDELFIHLASSPESGAFPTNRIQSVTLEKLPISIDAPTGISALGLDGVVNLAWDVMPGATSYNVYRSTVSGNYGAALAVVNSESYADSSVANGTTYYYVVEAVYNTGTSSQSQEASASPAAIFVDQNVANEDFEAYSLGDLSGQNNWNAISGSSNNAFAVINDGGQKLDTASVAADFDNAVGNAVYLNKLLRNSTDDVVSGSFDLVVSTDVGDGVTDSDHSNSGVLAFGLTSSASESLLTSKSTMALFHVLVRHENGVGIIFANDGNDSDQNRLAFLNYTELGWNPKKNALAGNGNPATWIGDPNAPSDYETDPVRVSWSIRKTREAGLYQAMASISNLTSGATSSSGKVYVDFDTATKSDMYETTAGIFAMGHYYKANAEGKTNTLHAAVDNLSVEHTSGVLPTVEAPVITSVISGDRSVAINWEPVLEATGYDLTITTPNAETYDVLSGSADTMVVDQPRINDVINSYTLSAVFDSDLSPNTASTNFSASPIGLVPTYSTEEAFGTATVNDSAITVVDDGTSWMYLDAQTTPFFENGVSGYTGPNIYGVFQGADTDLAINVRIQSNGQKVNFRLPTSGWNTYPWASKLAYILVSEMGGAETSLDADSKTTNIRARWGNWTIGNSGDVNNGCRVAIRNGTSWYVSDALYANGGNGGDTREVTVADVAGSMWRPLTVNLGSEMTFGAAEEGSTLGLTDINAIGWFQNRFWASTIFELDVQQLGALSSFDYWASQNGLDDTNSGVNDDPDGDGVNNRAEYIQGTDPMVTNEPVHGQFIQKDDGSFAYTYRVRRDPVKSYSQKMQTTEDLVFGTWTDMTVENEIVENYEWSTISNSVPSTTDQLFIRLMEE